MGRRTVLSEIDRQIASMTDEQIALGLADRLVQSVEDLEKAYFGSVSSLQERENKYRITCLYSLAAAEFSGQDEDDGKPPAWTKIIRDTIGHIDSAHGTMLDEELFGPKPLREIGRLKRSATAHIIEPPGSKLSGKKFAAAVLIGAVTVKLLDEPPPIDLADA